MITVAQPTLASQPMVPTQLSLVGEALQLTFILPPSAPTQVDAGRKE